MFSASAWVLVVLYKRGGGKLGKIPLNDELLQAIQHYRELFNLTPLLQPDELLPIIPS